MIISELWDSWFSFFEKLIAVFSDFYRQFFTFIKIKKKFKFDLSFMVSMQFITKGESEFLENVFLIKKNIRKFWISVPVPESPGLRP